MAAGERKCLGSNAKGAPCQAAPLSGSEWCRAHDPNLSDESRFGSPEQAAAAGASPKPHRITEREAWNEMVRERKNELWAKGWELMNATETRVSGEGDNAFAEQVPNYTVQIRAYVDFMDRYLGKATDKLELTGENGAPIQTEATLDIADPETRKLAHDLLQRRASGDE